MASPFYLFRKYQKTFLAIAGVLAMFIFVVADPLMSWLQQAGGAQRSANTVVASWDGGSLNYQQLRNLAQRRAKISEFLRFLYITAASQTEQEGGTPLPPSLPNFIIENEDFKSIQVNCVSTRVLAELAKKSGITVSDGFINHYLREWGLRRIGDAEIASLLSRVGISDKTLFAGLRELLMGNFYINSYSLATLGILPEERWQDWKRINERIAVEAAILPTEKFIADVPEPSDAELKSFYEQHKDREDGLLQLVMNARLPSPDPGFREPRRIKLQYLLGNVDDWTQKMLDTVTDEEIADYYERNKRTQFIKTSSSGTTSTSIEGLFDDEPESSSEESTDESPEESSEESTDNAPAEESVPEAEETEAEETEADSPAEEATDAPADPPSAQRPTNNPFRLTALQTETEAEATTGDAESSGEEAAETVAEEAAAESKEAAEEAEPDGGEIESTTASEAEGDEAAEDEEPPVEYEPLENVREQIRRSLATDKAVVEMQAVVDRTFGRLQSAYNPYGFKIVTARTEEREIPAAPKALSDYIAIAAETGLVSEETELVSQMELAELPVGKAIDVQSRREFVVRAMFGDKEIYEPFRAADLDGNAYIVCKTEDVPSRVPEFDEVRDAVVAAWKEQEAAKLALAKAEELAKQGQDSGDTVATVARSAGYEMVTTDLFSWLTFGTTPQEMQRGIPRLGDAPPLTAVGDEFMVKAFDLQPDQKAAVQNHDRSNAYVIQLDRREQTEAEMRQQFLSEANSWFGDRMMSNARWGSAQRQLLGQLSEEVGLDLDKLEEILADDSQ